MTARHDPHRPHRHEPRLHPPSSEPSFHFAGQDGVQRLITVEQLHTLPATTVPDCTIVSTGHGTSGPFAFTGVRLLDLVEAFEGGAWQQVEVLGADGFGARIPRSELAVAHAARPILLAYAVDGQPLSRERGLVRLIVPGETDDALRQVKWVQQIRVRL